MEFLLSIIKWLSQVLILIVGISALLSDPYRKNEKTGRRTLTRTGWIHIAMIGVGFILFGISDYAERQEKTEKAKQSAQQIEKQDRMIDEQKTIIASQEIVAQNQNDLLKTQQQQAEEQRTIIKSQENLGQAQKDVLKNQEQQIADQQIQLSQSKQLDLARYKLADLELSMVSLNNRAYQRLLEAFSEAYTIEQPDGQKRVPPMIRRCLDAEPQRHLCDFEIARTTNDSFTINFINSVPISRLESAHLSIVADKDIWLLISKIIRSTIYRNLEIIDDSGASLLSLSDNSFIRTMSLKKGQIEIDFGGMNLRLDQLSNNRFTFKMQGYGDQGEDEGGLVISGIRSPRMRMKSRDPHVVWDQTFELKDGRRGGIVQYEDGLTGERGFETEYSFGPYAIKVRFRK